jgi:hypothetical protein
MKNNKIKAGIIIDAGPIPYLIYDLIEKSLNQDKYEFVAIFIQHNTNSPKNIISKLIDYISRRGFKKFIESIFFAFIKKIEKFALIKFYNLGIIFQTKDINSFDCKVIDVYPKISKSGLIYRFSNKDIEKIKDMKIDVLVRGGSGILKGEILNICSKGILSFHHADNDINRGGPPGFWEVFYRQSSTGFIIQKLSEELDGGKVVFKGSIRTTYFYLLNWARICIKANYFLHRELMKLNDDECSQKKYIQKPYYNQLFTVPSISNQIRYIFQTLMIVFNKIWNKITLKKLIWGISYQFVEKWDSIVLRKSLKIQNTKNHFFADPFVSKYHNRNIVFFEDFDLTKNKACISALEINSDKSYELLGTVLEENFHLSYPYVFKHENNLFMCPESHKNNDIRLYKCKEYPMKWEFQKVLIKNVCAGDTNIFFHNEKWWLFTNIDSSDLSQYVGNEHDSELHIYYADNLYSDQWRRHKGNPVIFDSNYARNGGKIVNQDGILYRVYQTHDFNNYGKGFGVTKITKLTAEDFEEVKLFQIEPNFYKDITGTHHFSFENNLAVFDHWSIRRK